MSLLCWLGFHRWTYDMVCSSWHPHLYVIACRRCGKEQ